MWGLLAFMLLTEMKTVVAAMPQPCLMLSPSHDYAASPLLSVVVLWCKGLHLFDEMTGFKAWMVSHAQAESRTDRDFCAGWARTRKANGIVHVLTQFLLRSPIHIGGSS
jgi:hypothetical protein